MRKYPTYISHAGKRQWYVMIYDHSRRIYWQGRCYDTRAEARAVMSRLPLCML
jgi:hypothetical protein